MKKIINKYADMFKNVSYNSDFIVAIEKKKEKLINAKQFIEPLFKNEMEYVSTLNELLRVKDIEGYKYIRVGHEADGGYVMVDNFVNTTKVYSIGIGNEISFDSYFAKRNMDIYMYDHTIEKLPYENSNFHFSRIGICGKENEEKNMMTLSEMISLNKHNNEEYMILKMDVEGFEWEVLKDIDSKDLEKFDQIVMELHGVCNLALKEKIVKSLNCINKTHQLVHIHGNNAGLAISLGDRILPDLLEVTYVNRNYYNFIDSTRFFPTELDQKNISLFSDIPLGYWN